MRLAWLGQAFLKPYIKLFLLICRHLKSERSRLYCSLWGKYFPYHEKVMEQLWRLYRLPLDISV